MVKSGGQAARKTPWGVRTRVSDAGRRRVGGGGRRAPRRTCAAERARGGSCGGRVAARQRRVGHVRHLCHALCASRHPRGRSAQQHRRQVRRKAHRGAPLAPHREQARETPRKRRAPGVARAPHTRRATTHAPNRGLCGAPGAARHDRPPRARARAQVLHVQGPRRVGPEGSLWGFLRRGGAVRARGKQRGWGGREEGGRQASLTALCLARRWARRRGWRGALASACRGWRG